MLTALLVLLTIGPAVADSEETPAESLHRWVEQYYEGYLRLNPLLATYNGDNRLNDRFTVEIAPDQLRRSLELERHALVGALAVVPATLDTQDRLTHRLFVRGRELAILGHDFPTHLLPVDPIQSWPVLMGMLGAGGSIQPFDNVRDYDNWLARLDGWGPWVDQAIRTRLEQAYLDAIEKKVVPPYRKLRDFVRNSYRSRARETYGLSDLPGGTEWYAFLVRMRTTTVMTPEEIHQLGRAEVERISAEIARTENRPWTRSSGGPSSSYGPLLDGYRQLRARVSDRLPLLFSRVPQAEFEVRAVEAFRRGSAPGASYVAGSPDGSRPGVFYVNAGPDARGVPSEALFLHEAIPGHHFQISLQRELADLPRFRRFGQFTAYTEGWSSIPDFTRWAGAGSRRSPTWGVRERSTATWSCPVRRWRTRSVNCAS